MDTLGNFTKTYITAWVVISLPFIILIVLSFGIAVNLEVIVYGLTLSFISSFAVAYYFRPYSQKVTFADKELFVNTLINSLTKQGYAIKDQKPEAVIFEPTVHAPLFAGDISLQLASHQATLAGARLPVRRGLAGIWRKKPSELKKGLTLGDDCVTVWKENKSQISSLLEDNLVNYSQFEQAEELRPDVQDTTKTD